MFVKKKNINLISFPCVPLKETRKNHTCFTKKKTKPWSTRPELWIGLIIVSGQHKNKSGDYYSFKTRFEGRSKTKSRSQVTLIIDSGHHKDKKIIIIVLKLIFIVDQGLGVGHESS
jgi:hypothetical protein